MNNPFALVILAVQKSQLENKISAIELNNERLIIARAFIATKKEDAEKTGQFILFLKAMLYIENEKINHSFNQEIITLTGGKINMGILEELRMIDHEEGKLEGKFENAKELKLLGVDIEILAKGIGLSIAEIEAL